MKKLILLVLVSTALTSCGTKEPCTPQTIEATVDTVYFQPQGYATAQSFIGTATIVTEGAYRGRKVQYSTRYVVEVGQNIIERTGCGLFPQNNFYLVE